MAFLNRSSGRSNVSTTFVKGARYETKEEFGSQGLSNSGGRRKSYLYDPLDDLPGRDVDGTKEEAKTRRKSAGNLDSKQLSKSWNGSSKKEVRFTAQLPDDDYENSKSRSRTSRKGRCVLIAKAEVCKNGWQWNRRRVTLYEHALVLSKKTKRARIIRTSTGISETSVVGPSVLKNKLGKEIPLESIYKLHYADGDVFVITTSVHPRPRQIKMESRELASEFVNAIIKSAPQIKTEITLSTVEGTC
eukprot:TRINITY_DN2245_c2_g1_i1.p1 TRINITY_DN2245_c2_g1~~TRINITY_DN2245_c2_g1_i1.p1  ORF type:complete len:246 (-),score=41.02 TRINITY_DN2245_c2_g1_i1:66-803(-)